jgi:hypothetical protein
MQPVIWSHRIQRLDRLDGSPGSRAAASKSLGEKWFLTAAAAGG